MSDFKRAQCRHLYFTDWSVFDPRALNVEDGPISRVHHALHPLAGGTPETVTLSRDDAYALEVAADCYLHLTTHPAGTEAAIEQLRAIRRALRTLEGASR